MYIRITRVRFDPARYDEVMALAGDLVAALRHQPGFHGHYGAGDRTSGTAVAISLWDTQEHAQFDRSVLGDIFPRYQALGVQFEPAEVYEVVAHA